MSRLVFLLFLAIPILGRGGIPQPDEARFCIAAFMEKVTSNSQHHSALGYLPTAEFDAEQTEDYRVTATYGMSMSRHSGI